MKLIVAVTVVAISCATLLHAAIDAQVTFSEEERLALRDEVKSMFTHAYDGYMRCAFPRDELKPMSCSGTDAGITGGHAMTLIDTLDTLLIMGNRTEFEKQIKWVIENISFDTDITVSVFETNIRLVGGLMSAHFLAENQKLGFLSDPSSYKGELLSLAVDLAQRLMPAFDTQTGVPFGSVNLRHGVARGETPLTSTAGGGTYSLEFGLLSKLTGNPAFEKVSRLATRGLWSARSPLGLVGNHINVQSGEWTHKDSGVGAGIDSFFEYMLKSAVMFGDKEYMNMFEQAFQSIEHHVHKDPWYLEVHMQNGATTWPLANSLGNFWPGVLAMVGETESASKHLKAIHGVWKKYGAYPEGYNTNTHSAQPGQKGYPLRPEIAESAYVLYRVTGDRYWMNVGRDMITAIQANTRVEHGYAAMEDVDTKALRDNMDSFFLAETLKYLYLLFDSENFVNTGRYLFNTEGHIFPLDVRWMEPFDNSLPSVSEARGRVVRPSFWQRLSVDGLRLVDPKEGSIDAQCHLVS